MNKRNIIVFLAAVYICVTAFVIHRSKRDFANAKEANNALIEQLEKFFIAQRKNSRSEQKPENSRDAVGTKSLAELREDNQKLKEQQDESARKLAAATERNRALEEELDEILKPTREDILSSTLTTTLDQGEVIVTGGYQTVDGRFQYSIVEPIAEQLPDGRQAIRLQTRQYSLTPEVMKEFELDSLSTKAGNTLQHGEVWPMDELTSFNNNISKRTGADIVSAPQVIVFPGDKAEIMVGEYRMSTTPKISEDGSGFDVELRIEQPTNPNGLPLQ